MIIAMSFLQKENLKQNAINTKMDATGYVHVANPAWVWEAAHINIYFKIPTYGK